MKEKDPVKREIQHFLENDPLYTKSKIGLLGSTKEFEDLRPSVISLYCSHCDKTQPFRDPASDPRAKSGRVTNMGALVQKHIDSEKLEPLRGISHFYFRCTGCQLSEFRCWVEVSGVECWIQKVGQFPPWDISVSKELARALEDDTDTYKRAKICLSQGYGLAACAYLRRVLENRINHILELIYEYEKERGAPESKLSKIKSLLESKHVDEKLSHAYKYAPESVIVQGTNPLRVIYELLSRGIHNLSEDECTDSAMKLKTNLEYVLGELAREQKARRDFVTQMRTVSKNQP